MKKIICCFALLFIALGCEHDHPNSETAQSNQNRNAQQDKRITTGNKRQETQMDAAAKELTLASNAEKFLTNSIGANLVYIPPGEFMMGSPSNELSRASDEGPQHLVKITRGFYLSVTEVTQAQYRAIMGTNPSYFEGEDNPVENVSWNDAVEFCKKLSGIEGRAFRLPTSAEWEYACRAGTDTPFNTRDTIDPNQANYAGAYAYGDGDEGVYHKRTIAVGSFSPNAFGLYDMHGNVWEWCQDWYDANYYSTDPTADPQGPSTGASRVLRGGSWISYPRHCRSAFRGGGAPWGRFGIGFRFLLDLN